MCLNHPTMAQAPGTLVISLYAACPDIYKTVTPDIKKAGKSSLYYLDLSIGKARLGGSALATVYKQVGEDCPDVEDSEKLIKAFKATQECLKKSLILAGHDRSDGGLIATLCEMAFSGDWYGVVCCSSCRQRFRS